MKNKKHHSPGKGRVVTNVSVQKLLQNKKSKESFWRAVNKVKDHGQSKLYHIGDDGLHRLKRLSHTTHK